MTPNREGLERDLREAREIMNSARSFMELARVPLAESRVVLDFIRRSHITLSVWTPRMLEARRRIRRARLFDAAYYARTGRLDAGHASLRHYLAWGWRSSLNPHPLFDTAFYQRCNPDVVARHVNPLVHYVTFGAREGRNPHPLFDTTYYLAHCRDSAARARPLVHYLNADPRTAANPHPLFDQQFYLAAQPEVAAAGVNPLVHYLTQGASEGADPHPLFDTAYYLRRNADVVAAHINPLAHFVADGADQGRYPNPVFDPWFYRDQNPDVVARRENPLTHFWLRGFADFEEPLPPPRRSAVNWVGTVPEPGVRRMRRAGPAEVRVGAH